jgi:hypothetical protein
LGTTAKPEDLTSLESALIVLDVFAENEAEDEFLELRRPMAIRQNTILRVSMLCAAVSLIGAFTAASASLARLATPTQPSQDKVVSSTGLGYELDASEADALQVVAAVAQDSIVRGTYVYEKQKTLTGAIPANSSTYFGQWTGAGHAFYKIFKGAVAPRHFRDSSDMGTITVRYIVQPHGESKVHLWIEAVFIEDASRKAALSDGTVESSEFKEIQDRLRQIQATDQETATLLRNRKEDDERQSALLRDHQEEMARLESAEASLKSLEPRLRELRQKLVIRVANENTELKTAPFHSATKIQFLKAGEELVVLIVTPSWIGVETGDKHRGWLRHDQVEPLP